MNAEHRELPWILDEQARISPGAPAVITPKGTFSYEWFVARVESAAEAFGEEGVVAGEYVAATASSTLAGIVYLLALQRMGAAASCFNPEWPDAYAEAVAAQAGCKLLGEASAKHRPPRTNSGEQGGIPADRPAAIIMTSGSTGGPKAALLSYGNLYFNGLYSNRNIPVAPGEAWLLSLPLYHVSGLGILFRAFLGGAAVALPEDRAALELALGDERITHVSLVGAQLQRLLEQPETLPRLRRLKAILLGGSAIPERLIRRAHEAGLRLHTTYGMTEMASQITTTPPDAPLETLLSSGRPLHPDSIRISATGEIEVAGPTLFLGYAAGEALTRPLTADGYFQTGDLGFWDDAGCLHVTGRRDNLFQVGGENVQPEEVERVLNGVPDVLGAVVVTLADRVFGHVPVAFVRMRNGTELAPELLRAYVQKVLPRHKTPRHFFSWPDDLPQGMKISRATFAQRAAELISRDAT